jgi:hypothetical protein
MKDILDLIQQRKEEFARLPLFKYLQDTSIHPRQRLAFAPALSPMVMGFGDLWRYVFRDELSTDQLQVLLNLHTYEEEFHWRWILEDIPKLGLDQNMRFSDSLKFLWSEETQKTRRVCPIIERYASQPNPVQKLVIIQVSEATANVFFSTTEEVIKELRIITKEEYKYFGYNHLGKENDHYINELEIVDYFKKIEITDFQKEAFISLVDELFNVFIESMDELFVYLQKLEVERVLQQVA